MRQILLVASLACLVACGGGGDYTPPGTEPDTTPDSDPTLGGFSSTIDLSDGSVNGHLDETEQPTATALPAVRIAGGPTTVATADTFGPDGYTVPTGTQDVAALYITVSELSRAQWRQLVDASGAAVPREPWTTIQPAALAGAANDALPASGLAKADLEAVLTAWNAAHGSQVHLQLPTGAQWERIGRGDGSARYPWGDATQPPDLADRALVAGTASGTGPRPITVGATGSNGVRDLAGNLWEWTSDTGLRGGSWADPVEAASIGNRLAVDPAIPYATAGARLVVVPAP